MRACALRVGDVAGWHASGMCRFDAVVVAGGAARRLPYPSKRALLTDVTTSAVEDLDGWSTDYDTWRDLADVR